MYKFTASIPFWMLFLPVLALGRETVDEALLPPPKKLLPQTLVAGTFRIEVEHYDSPSRSTDPTHPSGLGRIRFSCAPINLPFPWTGVLPRIYAFSIVKTVLNPLTQISLADAILIDPSAAIGGSIHLRLPERLVKAQHLADIHLLLNDIRGLFGPQGIRVYFHDIRWNGPVAPTVVLTGGSATYPTSPAIPPVPVQLPIEPGFVLAIDSLVITPARAEARGSVRLPTCLVSSTQCTRISLSLPWTTITSNCELYREVPDSTFGPYAVGETGIEVLGRGYTIDFSGSRSNTSVTPPLGNSWKGVVFTAGETPAPPSDTIISNRGYVKAQYTFTNGLVTSGGLDARLNLAARFLFQTLEPIGYLVELPRAGGFLQLGSCGVVGGSFFGGQIQLPTAAIRDNSGLRVHAPYDTLSVQDDMDLFGAVRVPGGFTWGEFSKSPFPERFYELDPDITSPFATGYFYLAARHRLPFYPIAGGTFTRLFIDTPAVQLEAMGIQGVTLTSLGHRTFTIWTQDVPGNFITHTRKLVFRDSSVFVSWMNIIGTGIHTEIRVAKYIAQPDEVDLGPTWATNPRYLGETALHVSFAAYPQEKQRQMVMQFVESATWYSNFDGRIFLGGPMKDTTRFSNLVFTSTANAGGAQLDLSNTLDMKYWDVTTVPRDSLNSGGVVCVKLGVIYLTAAGIDEPRHFARPFWLTWGEIKASGNLGRLFFDYNSPGQCFDQIPYSPSLVQLSDYNPAMPNDTGFVITYGSLAFSFFGAKPLWVLDWKAPTMVQPPWSGRLVRTPLSTPFGPGMSDLHLTRNWGDGVANLDFTVGYDSVMQEGFTGPGEAKITKFAIFNDPLHGSIDVKAGRSCFTLNHETDDAFNLGPLLTTSALKKIWGCGCIVGDNLERIAVGGEMSANAGAGFSILGRTAGAVTAVLGYSPSRTDMMFSGDAYAVLLTRNVEVIGFLTVTINRDVGYAEGYARGAFSFDGLVTGVSGEGELQWHFGSDNETVQGRIAISMYHISSAASGSSTSGKEAGAWFGINTNKDNVWVMDGINGEFGLNKAALPQYLSGFYAYVSWSDAGNYGYVLSGGYEAFAGLGAIVGFGGDIGDGFGAIGNVGLHIWGKFAGGLASADAWGDLQILAGYPPAFEGTIGVDLCVLFACVSENVHAGFNASQGFYLY